LLPLLKRTSLGIDERYGCDFRDFGPDTSEAGHCTGIDANSRAETRITQGSPELSTGNCLCFESGYPECKENTRCCGFLLTCTTDSGIFSSAAVNGL
jgi:hypothetical protein